MVINIGINILNAPKKFMEIPSNKMEPSQDPPHIARVLVHQAALLNVIHAPQNSLRDMDFLQEHSLSNKHYLLPLEIETLSVL